MPPPPPSSSSATTTSATNANRCAAARSRTRRVAYRTSSSSYRTSTCSCHDRRGRRAFRGSNLASAHVSPTPATTTAASTTTRRGASIVAAAPWPTQTPPSAISLPARPRTSTIAPTYPSSRRCCNHQDKASTRSLRRTRGRHSTTTTASRCCLTRKCSRR